MRRRVACGVAGLVLAITAACGGGNGGNDEGDDGVASTPTEEATSKAASESATKPTSERETPQFLGDLERVCTTQVGFLGLTPYQAGRGMVHPMVLFEDYRGEGFIESSRTLPVGWQVEQDEDYEDNQDLKVTELVACSDRIAEAPTGVVCTFDGDEDEAPAKLELVNATYEVKVYAATTGELLHTTTLEAKNTECPFIATFKKGDTTFVDEPSDNDYIGALKGIVTP